MVLVGGKRAPNVIRMVCRAHIIETKSEGRHVENFTNQAKGQECPVGWSVCVGGFCARTGAIGAGIACGEKFYSG